MGGAIDQFAMQRFLTSKPHATVRWQHFGHAAIGKAQAHTIALQQHQLALHTGEGRERRILFDLGHGQAQRPVIAVGREAQDPAPSSIHWRSVAASACNRSCT
ncbi:hypothetical protein G6F59_016564 [Rhizopus arrhizus]|nr:hypothetical protein G6F59_016564 [Rhizopus arrhizus]